MAVFSDEPAGARKNKKRPALRGIFAAQNQRQKAKFPPRLKKFLTPLAVYSGNEQTLTKEIKERDWAEFTKPMDPF